MRTLAPVLALLALAACKQPGSSEPVVVTTMNATATITPAERGTGEVLAVLRSQCAAWNRGDLEGFMDAGYWRSPDLTFFSQGSITKGYDAVLERYTKRYKSE